MDKINIGNLDLCRFDKDNKNHIDFFKKIIKDETISIRFQGLLYNLMKKDDDSFFNKGFLIQSSEQLIGYVDISGYNTIEECVYLRMAIDHDARGNNYGRVALKEISDYLFNKYNIIKCIKLKIAHDNIPSLKIADACGYKLLNSDYYFLNNPYLKLNNEENLHIK